MPMKLLNIACRITVTVFLLSFAGLSDVVVPVDSARADMDELTNEQMNWVSGNPSVPFDTPQDGPGDAAGGQDDETEDPALRYVRVKKVKPRDADVDELVTEHAGKAGSDEFKPDSSLPWSPETGGLIPTAGSEINVIRNESMQQIGDGRVSTRIQGGVDVELRP